MRYPKPSSYRNPYVVQQKKEPHRCQDCSTKISNQATRCRNCVAIRLTKEPNRCQDCRVSIERVSIRCMSCCHKNMEGGNTATRVEELAASGRYATMMAIGKEVGVSRERVRQIIRQHNIPWQNYKTLLEWRCPGCDNWISVPLSEFNKGWNHMPAHCRACSQQHRSEFCQRGHLRAGNTGAQGTCLVCMRQQAKRVVEVRTCKICQQPLNISRGILNQIQQGHAHGNYHKKCYNRQRRKRTHCKHGHRFTTKNTYIAPNGSRYCKECNRIKLRAAYQRRKTTAT